MNGINDSTDSYYREKIEHKVKATIRKEMKPFMQRIEELEVFEEKLRKLIMGDIPPDPNHPSIWQALMGLMAWQSSVARALWILGTALVGAIATAAITLL